MRDWDNDLQSEREIMSGNSSTNVPVIPGFPDDGPQ